MLGGVVDRASILRMVLLRRRRHLAGRHLGGRHLVRHRRLPGRHHRLPREARVPRLRPRRRRLPGRRVVRRRRRRVVLRRRAARGAAAAEQQLRVRAAAVLRGVGERGHAAAAVVVRVDGAALARAVAEVVLRRDDLVVRVGLVLRVLRHDLVDVAAAVHCQLLVRAEDDNRYLCIAKDRQLGRLFDQAALPLGKRDLAVALVLDAISILRRPMTALSISQADRRTRDGYSWDAARQIQLSKDFVHEDRPTRGTSHESQPYITSHPAGAVHDGAGGAWADWQQRAQRASPSSFGRRGQRAAPSKKSRSSSIWARSAKKAASTPSPVRAEHATNGRLEPAARRAPSLSLTAQFPFASLLVATSAAAASGRAWRRTSRSHAGAARNDARSPASYTTSAPWTERK